MQSKKKIGPAAPLNQSFCTIKIKKISGGTHSHLPHDNIKKLGRLPPESSARFQPHKLRLFPFSFLFQHKQMYKHTTTRFNLKNVQNYHLRYPCEGGKSVSSLSRFLPPSWSLQKKNKKLCQFFFFIRRECSNVTNVE